MISMSMESFFFPPVAHCPFGLEGEKGGRGWRGGGQGEGIMGLCFVILLIL